jgi:twinfilin
VRAKTIFASTRATVIRELGSEKFTTTVFATEEEEVTSVDAWKERGLDTDGNVIGGGGHGSDGSKKSRYRREDLMGEKERELEAVRRAEEEARSGTAGRDIGIGGSLQRSSGAAGGGGGGGGGMNMRMPVDEDAKEALRGLQDGSLVQLVSSLPLCSKLISYFEERGYNVNRINDLRELCHTSQLLRYHKVC